MREEPRGRPEGTDGLALQPELLKARELISWFSVDLGYQAVVWLRLTARQPSLPRSSNNKSNTSALVARVFDGQLWVIQNVPGEHAISGGAVRVIGRGGSLWGEPLAVSHRPSAPATARGRAPAAASRGSPLGHGCEATADNGRRRWCGSKGRRARWFRRPIGLRCCMSPNGVANGVDEASRAAPSGEGSTGRRVKAWRERRRTPTGLSSRHLRQPPDVWASQDLCRQPSSSNRCVLPRCHQAAKQ